MYLLTSFSGNTSSQIMPLNHDLHVNAKEVKIIHFHFHYRFLFKGDGRAAPISTQTSSVRGDLSSRLSFDSGVPPSYPKRGSASYQQSPSINTPQRQASVDSQVSDSGHSSSPFDQPPPVHLHTHPSRRNSFKYENVDRDSGISSGTFISSRRSSTMSESQVDGLDDEQFQLEDDNGRSDPTTARHTTFSSPKTSHYQHPPTPIRCHTVSSPHPYQHASEYEKMIHPRAGLAQPSGTEEYVQMRPAHNRTQTFRSYSDSPPKHLHPISEDKIPSRQEQEGSNYENLSFQSNIKENDFEYYVPQYENMDQFKKDQKALYRHNSFSQGDDKGVKSASPSSSRNVRHVETPSPPVIISS